MHYAFTYALVSWINGSTRERLNMTINLQLIYTLLERKSLKAGSHSKFTRDLID